MAFPLQSTPFARHCGDPYPNIALHNTEDSLPQACLILSPAGQDSLHLTLTFPEYPLRASTVTVQSDTRHPNVFGTYICASIVNTIGGYTPAYTLKSIAIQLRIGLGDFEGSGFVSEMKDTVKTPVPCMHRSG